MIIKRSYKTAYREAVNFHGLSIDFLSNMHKKSKYTVKKWICEEKISPQFSDIFELYIYIRFAKLEMPTGISTIYHRHYHRAWVRAKKYLQG